MKLYRYVRSWEQISLIEYDIIKETPKTWTIMEGPIQHVIRKEEGRKRYAYSQKKDAWKNFKARTKKSLQLAQQQVDAANFFLEEIKKVEEQNLPIKIREYSPEIY